MKVFVKTVSLSFCVKTSFCTDVVASTLLLEATKFVSKASSLTAVSANLTSKGLN